jgi:large subunit ribosomal protein L7/L12
LQLGQRVVAASCRRRVAAQLQSTRTRLIDDFRHQRLEAPQQRRMLHTTASVWSEATVAVAPKSEDVMPPIIWTTHRLNQEQIAKVDRIFHKILWLDIFESAMLNELVNERLDLHMSPKQRRQLGAQMEARDAARSGESVGSSQAEAEPEEVGPVLVDLKLAGFEATSKIKVIKEVRSILGLGLKEAKEMVEGAPVTLQKGLKQEVADEVKAKLEAAGAQVELV